MDLLKDLNPQQKEAVIHTDGPLLVIAGAGTGKTQIITKRIAYLITAKKARPSQILALTFTDKAADQMQERVDILVPYGFVDAWLSTFHSFGDKVLRENALEIGLDPDFQILTRHQAVVFFREHLFEFPLNKYRPTSNPTKFIEALLSIFDRARDEDISVEEYLEFAQGLPRDTDAEKEDKERHIEIARCYKKYMELQIQEAKLDFSSQVYLALCLLRKRPSVLNKYHQEFKYILVDEFQDTNFCQLMLLTILAQAHKNIMVVCDDDQAIYRFRGAAFSNIMNFMKFYPDAKKISININYRSQKAILDTSFKLIQHNNPDRLAVQANIDKRLKPNKKKKVIPVKFYFFDNFNLEADRIASLIKERVSRDSYKYKDFAILVRSNNDSDPFLRALNIAAIPWRFSGNRGLYSQEEIRLCLSFLKLVANPADSLSLYYLIEKLYDPDTLELITLTNFASRINQSLFYVLTNLDNLENAPKINDKTREKIARVVKELKHYIELSTQESTGRLLYIWLTDKGILKTLLEQESLENEQKVRNIAKFFESIREYEGLTRENRLQYFVKYLDMVMEAGESPEIQEASLEVDAVNVLTVHKAKGLEFRVVIIAALVEGKFPWPKRSSVLQLPSQLHKDMLPQGDYHIQEERRLFYVALTRAKEEVILTSSQDYGGKRLRKISRFVYETLDVPKKILPEKREDIEKAIEAQAGKEAASKFMLGGIADGELLALSFYRIDDYLTCPLKYKFVHILRVPIIQHHSIVYGSALHKAVQKYNEEKKQKRTISEDKLWEAFLAAWRCEGFISREHEDLRLKEAKDALKRFYQSQESCGRLPHEVEKEFRFTFNKAVIRGRWDRIDLEEGLGVIIDFKSSSSVTVQEDADKRAKESLQMDLYSFAFYKSCGKLPKRVELHFLESGLIGRAEKTGKDFEKVEEKISKVEKGIRNRNFKPSPSYRSCNWCAYNRICPHTLLKLF
ncbi:MAG: ATP-dependent helicase [Candidatus Omnitrophica bacterium]|nr:ATP-dependent helicase [Candidatus Omnitrophota bacterium]